jgi:hypothetical protein
MTPLAHSQSLPAALGQQKHASRGHAVRPWTMLTVLVGLAVSLAGCGSTSHDATVMSQHQAAGVPTTTPQSCARTFLDLYKLSASDGFAGPNAEPVMATFRPGGISLGAARLVVLRRATRGLDGLCLVTFQEGPGYAEKLLFVDNYDAFTGSQAPANAPANTPVTQNATIEGGGVITLTGTAPPATSPSATTDTTPASPSNAASTRVALTTGPGRAPERSVGPATDRQGCPGSAADTEAGPGGSCAIAEAALSHLTEAYARTREIPAHIAVGQPPQLVTELSCDVQDYGSEIDCASGNTVVATIELRSITP